MNLAPRLSLPVAILTGPTATGKSGLAIDFARAHGGIEIINADSLLVYREMNIGTAKPTKEEQAGIPHHLIDLCPPDAPFSSADFVRHAFEAIHEIHARGNRALIVGGTGFYLKALIFGLWDAPASDPVIRAELEQCSPPKLYAQLYAQDPESALRITAHDRYRLIRALEIIHATGKTLTTVSASQNTSPHPDLKLWVIDRSKEETDQRISMRTQMMLHAGLVSEAQELLTSYPGARALESVGYKQVRDFLNGTVPQGRKFVPGLEGLRQEIELATRQLSKKQRTWFRGMKQAQTFMLEAEGAALKAEFETLYSAPVASQEQLR
ncbi:tRNA (adenosine(37)-N6)-dimethylallyltransferase MiaA [Bdellovibrionota bacterium FG-2]